MLDGLHALGIPALVTLYGSPGWANAHQAPKKEIPPTIRRLVENFAFLPHRAEAQTTVLSKSVGRAFALS